MLLSCPSRFRHLMLLHPFHFRNHLQAHRSQCHHLFHRLMFQLRFHLQHHLPFQHQLQLLILLLCHQHPLLGNLLLKILSLYCQFLPSLLKQVFLLSWHLEPLEFFSHPKELHLKLIFSYQPFFF